MLKGFKEFIMRGNVIDLAVAVVIGGAFGKVVDGFVSNIVTPILSAAGGGKVGEGLGIQLKEGGGAGTFINLGNILNAIIVFLLTAAVVYFIFVVPMNKWNERRNARKEPESTEDELTVLKEIRDQLARRP